MLEQLQSIPAVLDDHCAGIPPVVLKLQSLSRFEESRAPKLEGRGMENESSVSSVFFATGHDRRTQRLHTRKTNHTVAGECAEMTKLKLCYASFRD